MWRTVYGQHYLETGNNYNDKNKFLKESKGSESESKNNNCNEI
jgi:hypothetical protein